MVEPDFKVYLIWSLPGSVFSEDIKNKQTKTQSVRGRGVSREKE